jgi:phage tail-like protein
MAIINNRSQLTTDPLRNFRFLVTFTPLDATNDKMSALSSATMGFTSVSGLSVATDSIPYREGGYNTTVHQIPGQTTFTPLTLQRGVMLGTNRNWEWMKNMFATVGGAGSTRGVDKNFRCNIDIKVLAHPIPSGGSEDVTPGTIPTGSPAGTTPTGGTTASTDVVAMQFRVYNAWPTAVAYSDLNAGDNALLVEQMTLVHEGFNIAWGTGLATDAVTTGL